MRVCVQLSVSPVLRDPTLSSGLHRHQTYKRCTDMHANTTETNVYAVIYNVELIAMTKLKINVLLKIM